MSHTKPNVIKSFLPIFYVSKIFGCNLYTLPSPLNATNINASPTAIDVLFGVIQFALYVFIVFPFIKKWNSFDSVFNNAYATESGSSGLVVVVFIGQSLTYAVTVTNVIITFMDMRNSAIVRRILFSFTKFDEQVCEDVLT